MDEARQTKNQKDKCGGQANKQTGTIQTSAPLCFCPTHTYVAPLEEVSSWYGKKYCHANETKAKARQ